MEYLRNMGGVPEEHGRFLLHCKVYYPGNLLLPQPQSGYVDIILELQ
jgi:hypothetical protein